MPTFSFPTQWDSNEDIAAILTRVRTNDAAEMVIHDDGMGTNYHSLQCRDGIHIVAVDEVTGSKHSFTIHELESMLYQGDAFVVGGAGELRFDTHCLTSVSRHPFNTFGSKKAVLDTVRTIANARGEEIDERDLEILNNLPELQLTEIVIRYAQEPGYNLMQDLDLPAPTLN